MFSCKCLTSRVTCKTSACLTYIFQFYPVTIYNTSIALHTTELHNIQTISTVYQAIPSTIGNKSKEDKVKVTNLKNSPKFEYWNKHYTQHISWSCLIRCANMKWIRWVLLKIQSRHDSVHRQTDRQTRWNQYTPFQLRWSGGIKMKHHYIESTIKFHQPITFVSLFVFDSIYSYLWYFFHLDAC